MFRKIFLFIFWSVVVVMAVYQARSSERIKQFIQKFLSSPAAQKSPVSKRLKLNPPPLSKAVTLYLKNGSIISGEFLREDERRIAILWQGGEIEFTKGEIEKIQKGEFHTEREGLLFPEETPEEWPYQHSVVITLKDQRVLDEKIEAVYEDKIILKRELEEGGVIEQEISRSQIEYLSFKPVRSKRSREIEESLRTQFPKMKWVREGSFVLITDSYATWVNEYRKTIQQLATDFYFRFFPLLKEREPLLDHYVVIFDDWGNFIEYAISDGVPGWLVAGYFSPRTEVLFLFNTLGDTFSKLIDEAMIEKPAELMDGAVDAVKGQIDKRYHVFVEGQAHEVMKKFSTYHSILRGMYREETIKTLRHEMIHELFHNFGLQSVLLSKVEGHGKEEAGKKRAFLEEKDIQKKRDLLFELLQLKKETKQVQVGASNSWFVEGLAAYMEATPVGEKNKRWLYLFQKANRENAVIPIEQLTVYKMGSFPGMAYGAMESAYAQSWAFVHFLIHRYPTPFMQYLERISREKPKENEDILWLLEALGKDLRVLEGEFLEYMKQFPELEDPFLEQIDTVQRIIQSF